MVGELVVEEKWWMISWSDGINDLGLMDGCVCGGNNCGELNGWFRSFCNCCVFSIVVFVSSPFSVLFSLSHFPFSRCRRVTTTTAALTRNASRFTRNASRFTHNNTHQLTPKERVTHFQRTNNSLPNNKQLTSKEQTTHPQRTRNNTTETNNTTNQKRQFHRENALFGISFFLQARIHHSNRFS